MIQSNSQKEMRGTAKKGVYRGEYYAETNIGHLRTRSCLDFAYWAGFGFQRTCPNMTAVVREQPSDYSTTRANL